MFDIYIIEITVVIQDTMTSMRKGYKTGDNNSVPKTGSTTRNKIKVAVHTSVKKMQGAETDRQMSPYLSQSLENLVAIS
jgi:hypothetical protein